MRYGAHEKRICGGEPHTTNNRMELLAPIKALEALTSPCEVELISDSSYVVDGINQWLAGWIKKDFAKVKNPDLWREYLRVSAQHKVTAFWVKGHATHAENILCDRLAQQEAARQKAML